LSEAFKYPITKIPLSIAESDIDLRGATSQTKSKFRNHIISKTKAVTYSHPKSAVWIYDVGKVVRSQQPEKTYREYISTRF
jgi:hypothetical protein